MEDERFTRLYQHIQSMAIGRRKRERFSDADVLLVHFWATLNDATIAWACDNQNWPPEHQAWRKPSPSRMSRRLRRVEVREHLAALEQRLRPPPPPGAIPMIKIIDAKPLPIGGHSKDRDAKWGHAVKAKAKGYKLFCLTDDRGVIAWELHAMNTPEPQVARRLIPRLDGGGYLLGDSGYDSNALFDIAGVCNHQLIAPRKKPNTGLGHHPQSPRRLRSIDLLERSPDPFGVELYKRRTAIERTFGHMGNCVGGLGPLPNWVRTLPRVRRWVHAKIILDAVRLQLLREKQALVA